MCAIVPYPPCWPDIELPGVEVYLNVRKHMGVAAVFRKGKESPVASGDVQTPWIVQANNAISKFQKDKFLLVSSHRGGGVKTRTTPERLRFFADI